MPNQNDPMAMEEYLKLLGLGNDNARIDDAIKMQMAQADFLRKSGAPQIRDSGRVMRAPGALELIGALAQQKAAGDLTKKSQSLKEKQHANTAAQNEALIRALMQQPPPPIPNAAPGMTPGSRPADGTLNPNVPFRGSYGF